MVGHRRSRNDGQLCHARRHELRQLHRIHAYLEASEANLNNVIWLVRHQPQCHHHAVRQIRGQG